MQRAAWKSSPSILRLLDSMGIFVCFPAFYVLRSTTPSIFNSLISKSSRAGGGQVTAFCQSKLCYLFPLTPQCTPIGCSGCSLTMAPTTWRAAPSPHDMVSSSHPTHHGQQAPPPQPNGGQPHPTQKMMGSPLPTQQMADRVPHTKWRQPLLPPDKMAASPLLPPHTD